MNKKTMNKKTMNKKIFNTNSLYLLLLGFILLVATVNRLYGLDRLSLWGDELWVVMASSKGSLLDMFTFVQYRDNHPPGHYVFTRYWQLAFGDTDYAIRFPFAAAGILLVYFSYRIAREHYSPEAGLIAAALVSSSRQAIYYSQEARANILVALTALWTVNYFYRLVFVGDHTRKNWVAFWLSASVCCYLHYAGTVFVASLALVFFVMFLLRREKAFFLLGLKLFLPVALLYSPWMPGMYYHLTHTPANAWWLKPEWYSLYENFKWMFGYRGSTLFLYQLAFLFLLLQFGATVLRKKTNHFSSLLLLMIVLPVMVFFIKSRISQPVSDYRHFIFALPLLAMPAGCMLSLLFINFRNWIRNTLLVFAVILILVTQNLANVLGKLYVGPHLKPEYRQSVEALIINRGASDSDLSLIAANSHFYNHYLRRLLNGRSIDVVLGERSDLSTLASMLDNTHTGSFYFLELPQDGKREMITNMDIELAKIYQPVCRTHYLYSQLIKFDVHHRGDVDWEQLPDCRLSPR